jgi:hypothetical protein
MWDWKCQTCRAVGVEASEEAARMAVRAHDERHLTEAIKLMVDRGLLETRVMEGETEYRLTELCLKLFDGEPYVDKVLRSFLDGTH